MSLDPARLRIVRWPDPVLKARTALVDPADPEVAAVARRMIELMHDADGVGLAAPQVGLSWRLFVTNGRAVDPEDRVFINPTLRLDPDSGEERDEEGCLSLPGVHVKRDRAVAASIEAIGLDGTPFRLEGEGMLARIWQHEHDHLEGILIVDRMSPMDRLATRRALRDLRDAWEGAAAGR